MVARSLHRALRPIPHRRPPLSSFLALQIPILHRRDPLSQRTLRNRPHVSLQLQRKPPHARHGPPQPPRLYPPALSVHDGRSARQLGGVQSDDGGEGKEGGGGRAAGEDCEGEAGLVGGVDGEEEEGGEVMVIRGNEGKSQSKALRKYSFHHRILRLDGGDTDVHA